MGGGRVLNTNLNSNLGDLSFGAKGLGGEPQFEIWSPNQPCFFNIVTG